MVAPNPLGAFGGGGGQSGGGGGANPLGAFGGGGQQPPKKPGEGNPGAPQPEPMPFMSLDKDKYGMPYYGPGLKGFARKVFAKIFDPSKLVSRPTEQQATLIEQAGESGDDVLNDKLGWDKWIGKWTGVKAEDAAQSFAAINLSMKGTDTDPLTGEKTISEDMNIGEAIKTVTGTMYRGGGQVIATGLESLSLLEKGVRKGQAFNAALDEIGDGSTLLPDLSNSEEQLVKFMGDTPIAHRLGSLINAFNDNVNPGMVAYNALRAMTAGKNIAQKVTTIKNYQRASNMLYTMYWDSAKKEEYFRRVKAGENPDLLVSELENPWVELAGSVLGDPTTYMGMGLIGKVGKAKTPIRLFGKTIVELPWQTVGHVPGFSEILGLKNIGRARLASAGDEFIKIADEGMDKAFRALGEVADDRDAVKKLQGAVNAARVGVQKYATEYGFFASESSAKAELMKKTVGTVFQSMTGRFRNTDDVLDTFKAFRNISASDEQVAGRAFAQLKEAFGTMPFSHAGMQSMEFFNRLVDEVKIESLVTKHGNDLPKLVEEAMGGLNKVVDDMYPSVNDMMKAATELKTVGVNASERQKFLAKSFDDLKKSKPAVIWANGVNNAIAGNKVYSGLQGFYAGVLMGMRPAYAFRNLLSNSVHIYHDLGAQAGLEALTTGVEVFAKSTVGRALKKDWVAPVLERETAAIKKVLGFLPTQTGAGVGQAGQSGFGFLAVGQDIEKVHSAILTRYVVEAEMEKAMRYGGIPAVDGIAGLPKEMADRLYTHALETFGDVKETLKRFRNEQATGFAETWRSLELDPDFKDTLRRSNLLDELETIRKTAPDAVSFSEQMDGFVKKIDDLAKRTTDEPALVSGDNPLADVVVTIEKAFDEGGRKVMSEGELNQFRALVELRSQLRNVYQDYADVMRDRIGRMIPPDQMPQFEQRFSQLRQTLENGNVKWREYADNVYKGVYAQSKKGTPPAELWGQVRNVMLDIGDDGKPVLKKISMADDFPNVNPAELTNTEFNGMLWKWFKEKQSSFWRSYTQSSLMGQDGILDEMAQFAGANIDQIKLDEFKDLNNPRLKQITDLTQQIGDWETHLDYDSFARVQPNAKEVNTLLETGEEGVRNAGNVNAPPSVSESVTISSDIEGNPLALLREKGGINIAEFGDVTGGKIGKDKQGVLPGLFNKAGMGIDDAGRVLSDAGFITPEQADDANFVREFLRNPTGKTKTFTTEGTKLSQMDLSGVPNWRGGKSHLFNAVNAERAAKQLPRYSTIDEVPFEEAAALLKKRTAPIPPYVETTQPTVTRQLLENMKGGLREVLDGFKNTTLEKWGQTVPIDSKLNDEMEQGLSKWASEMDRRTVSNRGAVAAIANETRNFILHDYNKTYADKFTSFFTMYHYWGSRNYARWGERVVDTPGTIAAYAKWKATMDKVHSDQPEFYRYNMQVKLPGMNTSPMFFNLEAALNPLAGLTGSDFNDPKKRVDWMSTAVDDMGKFGFGMAMPLQWAMAFNLYRKGEDEAARRWLGRLVPATQDLKSGLNLLKEKTGVDMMPDIGILPGAKYGEFDPFINMQGGLDAYEEKRVGRALSAMVLQGELSKEKAYDIMYNREGPEFDEAVHRAINERAPGQMASYFLGVGFKARTEGDMAVEEFYGKYYKLLALRENTSPEDYRQQFADLSDEYEFSDTVLLAARGGDDRDAAYAYNVLGRLPPGDSFKILSEIGLDEATISKFYDSKGDFSEWTPQDRDRFMSEMLDIGATFALPEGATRTEWNGAKQGYAEIRDAVAAEFGADVWDKMTTYYDLQDTNNDAATQFKADHPEINGALQLKRELVIDRPDVYKYYGSLDTIEAYYDGKTRSFLADKYGADITEKQQMYFNLKDESPAAARQFLNQTPELKKYWKEKSELEKPLNRAMVDFAAGLPQGDPAQLRTDESGEFVPANSTQEQLAGIAQNNAPSLVELTNGFSDGLLAQVQAYWMEGTELTRSGKSSLDYQSKRHGFYDADDMLRAIGLAMQQQGTPQEPQTDPMAAFGGP